MATITQQAPPGATPAVDGITSLSESLTMAQNLKAAITLFASANGLQMLSLLTDRIPELSKDITERDGKIKRLSAQLAGEKEDHSTGLQTQLRTFTIEYDAWRDKENVLLTKMKECEKGLVEMTGEMEKLQAELDVVKIKGTQLVSKIKEKDHVLNEKVQRITDLEKQLKVIQATADNYSKTMSQSHSQIAELQTTLKNKTTQYEILEKTSTRTKEKLQVILGLAAPLKEISEDTVAAGLEDLWRTATTLVVRFMNKDLPDEMLKNNWDSFRVNLVFHHQIPLPQSNSDIAKDMRIARTLGMLARFIDQHIFQPVYQLPGDSGVRELLRNQATVNQKKERFARATILSMFPEEEEENANQRIKSVREDLLKDGSIRAFMSHETVELFEKELETFLTRVRDFWRPVQYSKQRFEPDFEYANLSTNLQWHNIELQVADGKKGEQSESSESPNGFDDDFVIFPRVYLMGGEPKPITAGTILRQARVREAALEVRRIASHIPFAPTGSARGQNRTSRTASIGGEGARRRPTANNFLFRQTHV